MNKRVVDVADYAGVIFEALAQGGVLLTTKVGEKVNSMVIGWGYLGRIWNKPSFAVYVRDSRYTRELLDASPEFTINVPLGSRDKNAIKICGTQSGRDMDKIAACGLTLVEPEVVSVPGLKEFPLTLECRVLYRDEQKSARLDDDIKGKIYTIETGSHTEYIGEIVAAYVVEDGEK